MKPPGAAPEMMLSIVGLIRFRASCQCDPLLPAVQWLLFHHVSFCYYLSWNRFFVRIVILLCSFICAVFAEMHFLHVCSCEITIKV